MIDFAASSLRSLFDEHAGSLLRRLPLLLGSCFMWLAVLSVLLDQAPLTLVDKAAHWLGWSWSTASLAEWLAERTTVLAGAGLFVAVIAVLGVLHGAERWLNTTHGPSAVAFAFVLWQQVGASASLRVLIVVSLAGLAWFVHRDIEDILIATVIPVILLCLTPAGLLASALGFTGRRTADARTGGATP